MTAGVNFDRKREKMFGFRSTNSLIQWEQGKAEALKTLHQ